MHAKAAASAIFDHFGVQGKLEEYDGKWYVECRGIKTATGDIDLEVGLKDWTGDDGDALDLDGITAGRGKSGVGRQAMEVLEAYCRPRSVRLTLFALEGAEPFFRKLDWLEEVPQGSRLFQSVW